MPHRALRLLNSLGLLLVILLAAAPAVAQEGGGMSTAERPLPPPEQILETRLALTDMFDDYFAIAEARGWKDIGNNASVARGLVQQMSDADVAVFVPALDRLHALSDANADLLAALLSPPPPPDATQPERKSATLPDPQYSTICGSTGSDSDALFAATLTYLIAKTALEVAKDACNQTIIAPLPLAGCAGGNTRIVCVIASAAMAVAESVFGLIDVCDHLIELQEATAVYERMQHIHDDLQKMAEDLDFIRKMLTCVPVIPLKVRSGCNGTDDDCDTPKVIDECEEDVFGPTVYIQPAVADVWYPSLAALRQAAQGAVIAVDDCQSVVIGNVSLTGGCDAVVATVTATDACGNATTTSLVMKVDPTPPQVIIPPAIEGTCFSTVALAEATVLAQTSIADDCTPLDRLNVRVDSSLEGCELRVRIEATNLAGLRSIDATTVRVDPNPPIVDIDRAISLPWYSSTGEAIAALIRGTHVSDDCHEVALASPQLVGTCGSIVGRMTATDACGNSADAQVTLHVDSTPPTVSIPAGLANNCYASVEAAEQAVLAQVIALDDCTPRVDLALKVESTLSDCRVRVSVTATDLAGLSTTAGITLSVDSAAPTVVIDEVALSWKGDPLSFQASACFATNALAEAAVLAATRATDNCSSGGALTKTVSSSGNPCNLVVTARATDSCGLAGTDSVTLRVDATAPTVTCGSVTSVLTPADKRWVDVGLSYAISDTCTSGIVPVITVTSDESAWGGGTSPAPDAEILPPIGTGPYRVRLRAEANSPGDGRVYKINVRATDACGNTTVCTRTVTVPSTSGQQVDSGQYYNALAIN